jgi:hypothetical protein
MRLFALLLVAVLAALAGRAAAVRALDDLAAPTSASSRNASIRVGSPPDYGYKNTKPLIGILAQPCSDCPGR